MKKLLLLTAVALAFVTSVAAESRVVIGYDMPRIALTGSGLSDDYASTKMNGFSVGYIYGIGIGETGLGIDVGAVYQYGSASEEYDWGGGDVEKCKTKMSNINIPVAVAYSVALGDNMAIRPYAGVNFRLGISAKDKFEGDSEKYSYYDEDYMGEGATFKRFKMGYLVGLDFEFSKFLVGYQYGSDFGAIGKGDWNDCFKYRWSTIRVGMKF